MLEQALAKKTGWTRVAFGDVVRKINDKGSVRAKSLEPGRAVS